VADEKKFLRKVLTKCRDGLPKAYASTASLALQERVLQSAAYQHANTLALYAAADNEVSTDKLLDEALVSRRRVLMPRVVNGRNLLLVRVNDRAELATGAFRLLEPTGTEIVPPADLGRALICVPGVAFSLMGQRLGRGFGYFDRFLAELDPQAITAGLAYSFQLLDRLPESPHDRRLNLIITQFATHVAREALSAKAKRADQGGIPGCW
jgi:5-formyltetrahydrofolate cyclo-ligase